jgi:hypothetical protein
VRRRIGLLAAGIAAMAAMAVGAPGALAVGGPNEAGNSGHFHPNKQPCASNPDHPHCPGPH